MADNVISKKTSEIILMCLCIFALFLPIYFSGVNSIYYPGFILVNFLAVLFLGNVLLHKKCELSLKKNRIFALVLLVGIGVFNMCSLYVNYRYLHWYEDQVNMTISLLFFLALVVLKKPDEVVTDRVIKFLIHTIIISNIVGIVCYFLGYSALNVENAQIDLIPIDPTYYEARFNWIYGHKNNYGFMLILFLALFVMYRKRFKNIGTYVVSIGVLYVGLIISHSYTSLFASFMIFIGQFTDYVVHKKIKIQRKHLIAIVPVAGVIGGFVLKMVKERNILTLGSRIPIWKESIRLILQSPYGIGTTYDTFAFAVPGLSFKVYNCHNMFLTFMWRFSIPVGLCYAFIFLLFIVYSLMCKFSFLTIGIWISLIVPMCMDSTILTTQLTLFLFVLYCIFFRDCEKKSE